MDVYIRHIDEFVIDGLRLGRHVHHDPRSLDYLVAADGTVASVSWQRRTPILDQGRIGSCTGNAAVGCLGTNPFFASVQHQRKLGMKLDEHDAVEVYSAATVLDGVAGTYPPDDTGSNGLSVAKVLRNSKLISGYKHITSIGAANTAIQQGPFITGTNWYTGMDQPGPEGIVSASGTVRGGHEYLCYSYDAQRDLWWFDNSWGVSWGIKGRFAYSSADFATLLSQEGDATVFTPLAPGASDAE